MKNTFAKAEGGQYTKLAMGVTFPGLQKKIVCKKIHVCRKKKGPHLTEKCIGVLNVSCLSMSNDFFIGIIL